MTERSASRSRDREGASSGLRRLSALASTPSGKLYRWPSLFGRATLVAGGEQHIVQVLDALGRLTQREPERELARFEHGLSELQPSLCRLLVQHFAAEESDAYYGVLQAGAPGLGSRIRLLKEEHVFLSKALSQLVRLAGERAASSDLAWQAMRLVAMLQAHERKESLLLRSFLLGEEG